LIGVFWAITSQIDTDPSFSSLLDGSVNFGVENAINATSNSWNAPSTSVSKFTDSDLPGLQPLPCEQYLEDLYNGVLNIGDPNELKVYGRRIQGWSQSPVPYWIAVHDISYDKIRWGSVFLKGKYYEYDIARAIVEILNASPPTALVIDIGGNIGWFTLMSRSMGFSVETFEPLKRNVARICESLRMNRWSNAAEKTYDKLLPPLARPVYVNIHDVGVGDQDNVKQTFNFHPTNPGEGSLHELGNLNRKWQKVNATQRTDTVSVISLDSFARGRGWFDDPVEIAILKVDIEGYEPKAFDGAKELLKSKMIKNILFEMSPDKPSSSEAPNVDMINLLINAGYTFHKWGLAQGPNHPNPFPDAPIDKLGELLVEKTMKTVKARQMNLWFKI
jgi:FkbM family methyltransferase